MTHVEPEPNKATLNDQQSLKGQLRFRGVDRCLAELRVLGWHLRDTFPDGLTVVHAGQVNDADEAFFRALVEHSHGVLRITYTGSGATPEPAAGDEETRAVSRDRDWIARDFGPDGGDPDWKQLRHRCARYLRCGDSWTVRWLLEELLGYPVVLPAAVAHLTGLVYQMQELSGEAELFYRLAQAGEGQGAYVGRNSLAMLYVRHHPAALRSLEYAEQLLTDSSGADDAPGDDGLLLDFALRRNALALVRMRMGKLDTAAGDMTTALDILGSAPETAHARAILRNNLGRLQAAAGRPAQQVESALREATELEPNLPEYWLDLAYHLARTGDAGGALVAVRRADELTNIVAEIPALLGFLLASAQQHPAAAREYLRAAARADDATDHLLEAVRQWCAADDYRQAGAALSRIGAMPDTDERAADLALLRLETTANLEAWPIELFVKQLESLAARFPESELVAENVAAMSGGPA